MTEELDIGYDLNSKDFLHMLDYEKQIFLDIHNADALVVCAKGLSYNTIIQNLLKVYCDPGNLIFVINCSDYEETYFKESLNNENTHVAASLASDREKNYLKGGIHFISTRIFVVDLLKKRIPIPHITGIVVLRAHAIIESCQEAFALRLYRQSNKTGFIKAFSNSAESFTFGYGHVEKVMRSLFVKELHIWPRFHVLIINSLKNYESSVIELHVPMTPKMIGLQTCILDLMNFTCRELKSTNKTLELHEITVENCLTKTFQRILQTQLDCVWHQLSSTTKQLLQDLRVLRELMSYMIYNDAVTLYSRMRRYRKKEYAQKNLSWILLDSAAYMFKLARERVYNDKQEFDPEFCPKWKVLTEILRVEIPADIKSNPERMKGQQKVLILCQSPLTCYQLKKILTRGPERYLFQRALCNQLEISKIAKHYSTFDVRSFQTEIIGEKDEEKQNLKIDPVDKTERISTRLTKGKRWLKDQIETKIEEPTEIESDNKDVLLETEEGDDDDEAFNKTSYFLTFSQKCHDGDIENKEDSFNMDGAYEDWPEMENMDLTALIEENRPVVCIQTFKNKHLGTMALDKTLREMQPNYIIMYESDVNAIRQIEVYESRLQRSPAQRMRVFFLIHNDTVEEQSYLTNLRREKQAFDLLIETKRNMVVPDYQDGKTEGSLKLQRELLKSPKKSTRQAGGQEEATKPEAVPRIIVDMREFRSELPCLIHRRGIEIEPVTITIGDYILTPDICIERKSISDLIGSLNCGRLYNQCVQMSRYYTKPMLLIEFDQNGSFNFQGHYLVAADNSRVTIMQKLQLLTLHFPKLRIVWSPSPYATAQLFEELKVYMISCCDYQV